MAEWFPIADPVLVFALVALLILLAPLVMGRWRLPGTIGLLLAGALLGPNALGVLARDSSFVLFGTVGLLYIMFTAALEIDMVVLRRYKLHSIVFGLLTFAIPQSIGTLVAYYLLGFDLLPAILLASLFASHTLLAYPVASRLGIARNQAVTAAVGGTIVTDTLALLVLAVIAGATRGEMDEHFWLRLGGSLVLYIFAILYGLPKLARWFFRNVGRDGVSEFVFVLSTVFGCASLAHLAGSEPIVGAFLAGLALNRLIPHNSTLMNRLQFTGNAIFIPFFLLSVGMLLDVAALVMDTRAMTVAVGMIGSVLITKWIAAEATRLLLGYSREQARVVFGLSVAQAAATLAATMVGYQLGLFDDAVVNGAILMMLVTCIIAPWQVDHYGRKVARRSELELSTDEDMPQRMLVSVSERAPVNQLLDLALLLRNTSQDQPVFPLTVIEDGDDASEQVAAAERVLSRAVEHLSAADVSSRPVTRIDLNLAAGVLKARRELNATEVVMGWSGRTTTPDFFFGSLLDSMLSDRDYSLVISRPRGPLTTCRRILLAIPPDAELEPGFANGVVLVKRIARQLDAELLLIGESRRARDVRERVAAVKPACDLNSMGTSRWTNVVRTINDKLQEGDMLVLYGSRPGGPAWRTAMGRLPARLAGIFPNVNLLLVFPAEPKQAQPDTVIFGPPPPTVMFDPRDARR